MVLNFFNQRSLYAAFLVLLVTSILSGLWFKTEQVLVASPELLNFYPWSGFALSVVQTLVLFATSALGLALVGSWIDCDRSSASKNFFHCTLPFVAFSFSFFGLCLFYQFILFAMGAGCYLFLKIKENWYFFSLRTKEPLLVLLLFFILFSWIYETVSPFYDRSFFSLSGRLDYFLPLEHGWENAKAYDFIGNFSQNYRLGGFSQGFYVISPLLSLIALVLDTPLIDVYSKYDLVKYSLFILYLFSSFGCYLLFRFGLRLSFVPSVLGGFAYILANSAFLSFVGNEYSKYIVPFTFLPWVMLCISQAYTKNRLELIFLAGLVAGLSQHVWTSAPESVALFIGFSFIYIFWMSTGKLLDGGFGLKNLKRFVLELAVFPIAVFVGMAYFFIPLFEAIALMEFGAMDTSTTMGFWWTGALEYYSSIFFRFEDMNLYKFAPGLYHVTGGPTIGFYTGQFSLFMIFFFLCRSLFFLCQKYLSKGSSENCQITSSELFFLVGLVFCLITFPMGHQGWFSKFMEFTGFLRVHNYLRVSMYFFFFALVVAMLGLHYLLKLKNIKTLFIAAGAYVLLLIGVYFSPLFPERIPDKIFLDVGFFVATLVLFSFLFCFSGRFKDYKVTFGRIFFLTLLVFCALIFPMEYEGWFSKFMEYTGWIKVHNYLQGNMSFSVIVAAILFLLCFIFWYFDRLKNKFSITGFPSFLLINSEKLVLGLIVILGALSYYTLYPSARDYLTEGPGNYLDKNRNFYSFRSAVVVLRGNRHDVGSYNYLDKRVEDFERLFESGRHQRMNLLYARHGGLNFNNKANEKGKTAIRDYKKNERSILKLLRQRHVPVNKFKKYLNDQRRKGKILQDTYEQAVKYLNLGDRKLAFFEVAAPTIDNFYLRDDNLFTQATVGVHPARLAPLQHLTYSSFQYYLRDEYSFFIHSSSEVTGTIFPIGKKHELGGPFFYVAVASYPSKNITFHLRSLYNASNQSDNLSRHMDSVIPEAKESYDFFIQNMSMKFIRPDPFLRKLLNIYGVDFVSFFQYYLDQKMNPDQNPQVLEDLRSQGFVEFKFPESYRASLKFPEVRKMRVFTNPQSYGRAYIAKWVKVIRPEDNLANEEMLSLDEWWPRSKVLTKNFKNHMSSIPKDIWRSIIIESSSLKDQQDPPQIFEGDNRVDIKKIIASKAVFEVDCQDEHCWFVYNTTILDGWKAYSDSEKLTVNKANLGFVGLKLKKGKQLVWLEYAPSSRIIGLLVTLSGWFLLFCFFLKQDGSHKKST